MDNKKIRARFKYFKVSDEVTDLVIERDQICIYTGSQFVSGDYALRATVEHIDNDLQNVTADNIGLCTSSSNSSKGQKSLKSWFNSQYCRDRNINYNTVAPVVRRAYDRELMGD